MKARHDPQISYWRDNALDGACLASARYAAHEFGRHVHDELVIAVTEKGAGQCRTRKGSDIATPGSVWVFGPGEYHCGQVWDTPGWHYRAIYLDMPGLNMLSNVFRADARDDKPLWVPPGLYWDRSLARLLLDAHIGPDDRQGTVPLMDRQSAWWGAMSLLFGRYGQPRPTLETVGREPRKMAMVREYIDAHYARDISVDELAALVHLSRYHLMRSFRKTFGLPPHAYANQVRLIAAKRLITAGHSPADAAAATGFYDQSHLNRLFKRAYGVTPGAYATLKPMP